MSYEVLETVAIVLGSLAVALFGMFRTADKHRARLAAFVEQKDLSRDFVYWTMGSDPPREL